jgi:DNA-directed RNA polymerase specialized sigma24 family protein
VSPRTNVERALATLDRDSRIVLTLLYVEGLTEDETAAALDRPVTWIQKVSEDALVTLLSRGSRTERRAA